MKRYIAIISAVLQMSLLLFFCTGCVKFSPKPRDTSTTADTETGCTVPMLNIIENGITDYVIIRAESSTSEETATAADFRNAVSQHLGTDIPIRTDLLNEKIGYTVSEKEILIGNTSRAESVAAAAELTGGNDFRISISGSKLVIVAGSPAALTEAVDAFIERYIISGERGKLIFMKTDEFSKYPENQSGELTIAGCGIGSFGVVCSTGYGKLMELKTSEFIGFIASAYGFNLPQSDSTTSNGKQHQIYIGECPLTEVEKATLIGDRDAVVSVKNGDLLLLGKDLYAVYEAIGMIEELLAASGSVKLDEGWTEEVDVNYLANSAMTYNVLGGSRTPERMETLAGVIREFMPDSFGTQELKGAWLEYLTLQLGDIYDSVGDEACETGYSETQYMRIFYNKYIYSLVDSGTLWLSDTPEIAGSKFSESKRVRLCTWVLLEEKATGRKLIHVNTHLDNSGDSARFMQLAVLLDIIDGLGDYPVILSGDFNAKEFSSIYNSVIYAGKNHITLHDSKYLTENRSTWRTYNGLGEGNSIIDYIFLSEGDFSVGRYYVNDRSYNGVWPSDHNAVFIEFKLITTS